MSALSSLLDAYRTIAQTQREKGTYFEDLIVCYLKNEPKYRDLYENVWTYADWARLQGINAQDAGIDLVARVRGTGEFHAIQCKLYAADHLLRRDDIDRFITASGKTAFTHRLLFSTCLQWTQHAEEAIENQTIPVSRVDLYDLETSVIDWSRYQPNQSAPLRHKKSLMPHQKGAVRAVLAGLQTADRGKLIMACGTGKTFTSLKIAESLAGSGSQVLFLVPSLALLSQSLTEWTQEADVTIHGFAVCSDSDVGKKGKRKEEDRVETLVHELRYPATTNAAKLAAAVAKRRGDEGMTVIFSTYHSIEVIHQAQEQHGLPSFDLIVCDEAHRTTGATFDDDESAFVRVHRQDCITAAKRLYMTATPRVYGTSAKARAETDNVVLCSMDDEALYGKDLHIITFSTAVQLGLLVDYKVIVLAVEEAHVSRRLQDLLKDENNQLKVDDAARIVGCWKALAKQGLTEADLSPMRRAVAFCQVIERVKDGKTHKVSSRQIADMFKLVVEAYQEQEEFETEARLICEAEHVDGAMNASQKEAKLVWLKEPSPDNTCRILSNVRCLSEGVDVPALDAVLFLTPRNSQVDVVQYVGRVMRNAPGKQLGYVILPVVIPVGKEPHEALNDNKTYAVVWQVLQALRSHDDRFDAMVNKLELAGHDPSKMEVIAITDKIQKKSTKPKDKGEYKRGPSGRGSHGIGEPAPMTYPVQQDLQFEIGEIERAIYAKLVQKVGNRHHWEDWANDIAKIANTHIDRIRGILENPDNTEEKSAFIAFAADLRHNLNDSIGDDEIIEMLAQHLITKPVFDALFEGYSFAQHNPISQAMQTVVDILESHQIGKEADTLQAFYDSVKFRAAGIDNAAGKQKIVVELYDKFFRNAFPKMSERLGIVYTPVEVVDFIIHSVNHLLQTEFNQTLGSKGVHILDPFTGTGTFITRLLQSGLITPEELPYKYRNEIHANEIVLLAYYIAAINIEATYHGILQCNYQPFEGICLTDTFQLHEKEDLGDAMLVKNNNNRRKRQKQLDIRVIMGNPPYSAGQGSANDNNQNIAYPGLDDRIRLTYADRSTATNKNALYDSYIRAIRWASDRIGDSGVVGFVTNAGYLDSNSADGLRKCLAEEFSSLYVFHLRGNQRTSGELSKKEGGKIFGSGSRAPIAISLLVKNPANEQQGQIYFHDIGDYLTREEKLARIVDFGSIDGISQANAWQSITPDQHGDWLNQRDDSFQQFIVLGDKSGTESLTLFENYSRGIETNRDVWCYNPSRASVEANMQRMIDFYNAEVDRFDQAHPGLDRAGREAKVDGFINTDPSLISWNRSLKQELSKCRKFVYQSECLIISLYRPFAKQWLYYNRTFNAYVNQMPKIFPDAGAENLVICVSGIGARSGFSAFMADSLPCLDMVEKGQCFPLYLYDEEQDAATEELRMDSLFGENSPVASGRKKRYALTDEGLEHFRKAYPGIEMSKEDVFYYVYGLLHAPWYREKYADNLAKELPRIPCVPGVDRFRAFCQAGHDLANLHLNYESIKPYPLTLTVHGDPKLTDADYQVEKMRYGKNGKEKDLTTIHYNERITVSGIPLEAYEYIVNGKPALDWVVERQCVKTDKDSGIMSDANDWAVDTMNDPRYPLDLIGKVVAVALGTKKMCSVLREQ